MKKSDVLRTLTWVIPLICFLLAGVLVFLQYRKLQTARTQVQTEQQEVETLRAQMANFPDQAGNERIPYVQDSNLEESLFLDNVRKKALDHKVHLDKWANEAPLTTPPPPAPGTPAPPPAMNNVRTLVSSVEVRGEYESVRAFIRDLLGSPRLLSIKTGTWNRAQEGADTVFSFKLHRYVSSQPPPTKPNNSAMFTGKTQGVTLLVPSSANTQFVPPSSAFGTAPFQRMALNPWRES